MKSSRILKKVKQILAVTDFEDNSPYICDCVMRICREVNVYGEDNCEKGYAIKDFIRVLIENKFSLEQWIRDNGYMSNEEIAELREWNIHGNHTMDHPPAVIKLYNTRQAFLDWMIEQYEAKGD